MLVFKFSILDIILTNLKQCFEFLLIDFMLHRSKLAEIKWNYLARLVGVLELTLSCLINYPICCFIQNSTSSWNPAALQ